MSSVFGPDTTLDEHGLPERVAACVLSGWLPLMNGMADDGSIRFDREHVRVSLHGESEHPGDAFSRGKIVNALWMINVLLSVVPLMLVGSLPVTQNPLVVWPLFAVMAVSGLFAIAVVNGSMELLSETQVVDHTLPERPDEELTALQDRFVDGEFDEAELADEVERVMNK